MTMMKTCPFVPFPDAFNAEKALEGSKISSQTLDLYERPTDKLGTHILSFDITQKQFIVGNVKRTLQLDFYRKRMSIKGGFEGTVFESRGNMIKSYEVDEKDHFLVRITFSTTSSPQEFWMETTDEIQKLFESLTEFRECCTRRSTSSSKQ
ncbi:hypothetical protein GPJ56_004103 [Histomonas meleagridis]|uniref:uncharacterized protein n=1 Tax=Histomonas meleagridis TaxID=135588 RepID=UPI003559B47E|nr:hypothetical protein GPJ56_004103 [Histomonas meleagridis]KAH0801444.1 hypothetical protein GO595_005696 [Histomonas meleagridis]